MFLTSVKITETKPCLGKPGLFSCMAEADVDVTEVLPYMNTILERPNYHPSVKSLRFNEDGIDFGLMGNRVHLSGFENLTQAYELFDWLKDLINDTYERKDEITPNYRAILKNSDKRVDHCYKRFK